MQGGEANGVWFHDLRRSFITNARRRGVPESVVMGAPRTASLALARPERHGTSSIGSGEPPPPWISRNRGHPSLHAQSPEPASTATCSGIDQARPHHGTGYENQKVTTQSVVVEFLCGRSAHHPVQYAGKRIQGSETPLHPVPCATSKMSSGHSQIGAAAVQRGATGSPRRTCDMPSWKRSTEPH